MKLCRLLVMRILAATRHRQRQDVLLAQLIRQPTPQLLPIPVGEDPFANTVRGAKPSWAAMVGASWPSQNRFQIT